MSPSGIMNKAKFWRLMADTKSESGGDFDEQGSLLRERLEKMAPDELRQFGRLFATLMNEAYRWDLRGAAHVINGSSSQQSFHSFRAWLMAQGQKQFEAALDDPDSLAEVAEAEIDGQAILDAIQETYEARLEEQLPGLELEDQDPVGEEWAEEDLPNLYPRLWEAFGDSDAEEEV